MVWGLPAKGAGLETGPLWQQNGEDRLPLDCPLSTMGDGKPLQRVAADFSLYRNI